jgi:hypothetical protein
MRLFLGKSALLVHPWSRQQGVLSWKMMARCHSTVQWTVGILPHASRKHFSGFEFFLLSSKVHARPAATNANRWAVEIMYIMKEAKTLNNSLMRSL